MKLNLIQKERFHIKMILVLVERLLCLVLISLILHMLITKHNILVLGRDLTQGINGTTIYAEKLYSPNFTVTRNKFCLSL